MQYLYTFQVRHKRIHLHRLVRHDNNPPFPWSKVYPGNISDKSVHALNLPWGWRSFPEDNPSSQLIGGIIYTKSGDLGKDLSCSPVATQMIEDSLCGNNIVITILCNPEPIYFQEPVDPKEDPTLVINLLSLISHFLRLILLAAEAKSYTSVYEIL